MSILEDEVATLKEQIVHLKSQLDHSDKEVVCLDYEFSASKMDSLETNDRALRLDMKMEKAQRANMPSKRENK